MLQMFHLFHMYVAEVLHVAALAAQEAGACEGGPRGHAGSEAGVGGPHVQQHTGQLGQEQQHAGRHSRRGRPRRPAGSEAGVGGPHLHMCIRMRGNWGWRSKQGNRS
jgi:hypothetical protein